jgi:peroxiredoxin
MAALPVGATAPDFELSGVIGEKPHQFRLSGYRGKKHVVIAFHPLDWTPT